MTEESLWTAEVRNSVENARRVMFKILDELEGDKTIVWDRRQQLMQRVNLFVEYKALKDHHGVTKSIYLDPEEPVGEYSPSTTPYMVFFLAPTMASLDSLCEFMDKSRKDTQTLYVVVFIPETSYIVREKLKERDGGQYQKRLESVKEVPLWWLPRDGDCLSLNEPQLPSRQLINGDWTYMHKCAQALNQLLTLVPGKVPLYSKGDWALNVAKMVTKMRSSDEETDSPGAGGIRINRVVIIDRWLDPLTPLLTQLTYSGLLDELFGVGMKGSVKVPLAEFEEKDDVDPFEMKEIYLSDDVYRCVRHTHINAMAYDLGGIQTELVKDENNFGNIEKMSLAESKILVRRLPEFQKKKKHFLTHRRLTDIIKEQLHEVVIPRVKLEKDLLEQSNGDKLVPFIEDAIMDAMDVTVILRLIAVHSLTSGGLKPIVLATYRKLVMQSYGVEAVNRMLKMQKMGLLKEKGDGGKFKCERLPLNFAHMKKTYQLLVDDVRESDRSHPAYAYSGYCSLLVKMLAEGDKVKWVDWKKNGEHGGLDDDRTAVFVIGGITRGELALIKQLPNISLVLTSALITGNHLVESLTTI